MSMTRREALKSMGSFVATSSLVGASAAAVAAPAAPTAATPGPYTLPPLPYAYDALEPHIDARTMEIHHSKHHAAYIANLNKAVAGNAAVGQKPVDELIANLNALPEGIRTVVRNNGGGHSNHSLFWQMLKKGAPSEPQNQLGEALGKKFGNFNSFKEEFAKAATSVFGSGWAWLSMDGAKELRIETTPNQNSPLMDARTPLLGLDVWEHAYYLKYQNRRADYITAFFNVVNWPFVESRYR